MSALSNVWIVDAVRTPIGKHRGTLSGVRPDDLAARTVAAVVERSAVPADCIDDVYLGCTNGVGEDSRNVARMAVLLAALPDEVPGALKPDRAQPWGDATMADTTIGWRFTNPAMPDRATASMSQTAENVAERCRIEREDQDAFALDSHRRAVAAQAEGRFDDELISVLVPVPKGEPLAVATDEGPRRDTTREHLARLRPAFRQGGTVTAGNSASINDGAAALELCGDEALQRLDRPPLARVVAAASGGVDPAYMGMGPVLATRRVLQRAGLTIDDVDLVELNEAFASQALVCIRELDLDPERVNPSGGAIALGHQFGCAGARLLVTLAWELRRRLARYGLATMCIGVGQRIAVVLENPEGA